MGHRQGLGAPQLFDADHDQHWNHIHGEDPYVCLGPAGSTVNEGNSVFPSGNNLPIEEVRCITNWSSGPQTNGFPLSTQITHSPHNHSDSLSMHDSLHPSVSLNPFLVPENHTHLAADNSTFELSVGSGRGQYKRKSPMIPSVIERVGASRYYCAGGSSSDISSSMDSRHESLNGEVEHRWEPISVPSNYDFSSGGESCHRSVRSRTAFDLNADIFRAHREANYPPHANPSSRPIGHINSPDYSTSGPTFPLLERNLVNQMSASHGRPIVPDPSTLNREVNPFISGSNIHNVPAPIGSGYSQVQDMGSSRNLVVSQNFHPGPGQASIASRSCFPPRLNPATNRVPVGSLRPGHAPPRPPIDEGPRFVTAESYPSRHQRQFSSAGWRNSDRSRSRLSAERYRSLSVDAFNHDRLTPEGMMIVDGSTMPGSRSLFDQHREMRLDVDNMTYEELLALGERIGSVSTGLSQNQLSKCLVETEYSSPDQIQGEDRCVICLEEYQNMEELGTVKACSHQYHVGCIKKWLSMKNLCPICKSAALPDDMKEKGQVNP